MADFILSIIGILAVIIPAIGLLSWIKDLSSRASPEPKIDSTTSRNSSLPKSIAIPKKITTTKDHSSTYSNKDKLNYSFRAVGVSYDNDDNVSRQEIIKKLHQNSKLHLQNQPTNEHDSKAIAIISEYGQIGYLPKKACKELSQFKLEAVNLQIISIGKSTKSSNFGISIKAFVEPPYLNKLTHLQVKHTELTTPPGLAKQYFDYSLAFECEFKPDTLKTNFQDGKYVPKGRLGIMPGDQNTICDAEGDTYSEIMAIPGFLCANSDFRLFLYRVISIGIFKLPIPGNFVRVIFKIKNPYLDNSFKQKFTLLETETKVLLDPVLCQSIYDSSIQAKFQEVTHYFKNGDYLLFNQSTTFIKGTVKVYPAQLIWVVLPKEEWHDRSEEIKLNLGLNAELVASNAIISALKNLPLIESKDYIELPTTRSYDHEELYDDVHPSDYEDYSQGDDSAQNYDDSEADYSLDFGYLDDGDFRE